MSPTPWSLDSLLRIDHQLSSQSAPHAYWCISAFLSLILGISCLRDKKAWKWQLQLSCLPRNKWSSVTKTPSSSRNSLYVRKENTFSQAEPHSQRFCPSVQHLCEILRGSLHWEEGWKSRSFIWQTHQRQDLLAHTQEHLYWEVYEIWRFQPYKRHWSKSQTPLSGQAGKDTLWTLHKPTITDFDVDRDKCF